MRTLSQLPLKKTMKKIIALSAVSVLSAAPVLAGPYVNSEVNTGFDAGDYESTLMEVHYGYEGTLGEKTEWYVQGGPALDFVDGDGTESKVSGKVGAKVALTEKLEGYGELSLISDDSWDISETDLGLKAGATYRF